LDIERRPFHPFQGGSGRRGVLEGLNARPAVTTEFGKILASWHALRSAPGTLYAKRGSLRQLSSNEKPVSPLYQVSFTLISLWAAEAYRLIAQLVSLNFEPLAAPLFPNVAVGAQRVDEVVPSSTLVFDERIQRDHSA
jgi:hypothetical protein